jgi:hypothetical protein
MKSGMEKGKQGMHSRWPEGVRLAAVVLALVWGVRCAAQTPAEAPPTAVSPAAPIAAPAGLSAAATAAPAGAQTTAAAPAVVSGTVLARARGQVQRFFDRFSNVACTESLTQLLLGKNGKPFYRENSVYDYQFQVNTGNGGLSFSETRDVRSPAFRDPGRSLLLTNGFASLLLVVHPMYEASYTFTEEGEEQVGAERLAKVKFTPVPGASSPAALRLRGRNYPLPLSGRLWIDPETGVVVKLEAQVDGSMSDVGLSGLRSEVQYAAHQFHEPDETVWIPETAVIDVQTPKQHWRNLHRFTNYKRFDVSVHEEIGQTR